MPENLLYYGDNLPVLREHIAAESVELIYLDPPFNSNRDYNVLYREPSGLEADAQIRAFGDTWHWVTPQTDYAFDDLTRFAPPRLVDMINGFIDMLGRNDMTAYLIMLAGRLVELHRVLKPNGTLFLHCDPAAGHYIKLVLDCIFGRDKMINQITWKRSSAHSDAKQGAKHMGRITDLIFWYAKGYTWTHNVQYMPYDESYVREFYRYVEEDTGRRYRLDNLTGPGGERKGNPQYEVMGVTRYWRYSKEKMEKLIAQGRVVQTRPGIVPAYKRYLDEMPGVSAQDIWTDILPVQSRSKEALGYPTQKPIALLKRIVAMASNPGDTILDPFAGCGTTITAAEVLAGRHWIGIDITHQAIRLIENRLSSSFSDCKYKKIGLPTTVSDARALAAQDTKEFELWAISLVGAQPRGGQPKAGADSGIDGVIYFPDSKTKRQVKVLVQVKSGKVGVNYIRDLRGTMERERAAIGLFLTLERPTAPMLTEASSTRFYKAQTMGMERSYPRLQILTIEGLLEGTEQPDLPLGAHAGLKAAEKHRANPEEFMSDMFTNSIDEDDELDVDDEI